MADLLQLMRPEIRTLKPYEPASYAEGMVRLNANESPWRPPGDGSRRGLNRYPEARPWTLTQRLAERFEVAADSLVVTRGSSEAIDLLVRSFCRPGQDAIVICPPTFGMYRAYADVHGARVVEIPLLRDQGFALNTQEILETWHHEVRIVFICSPNNPTGTLVPRATLNKLCEGLAGRGLVALDAAYAEFSAQYDLSDLLARHSNLVVMRTLSKALGLAGVRCGVLLADAAIAGPIGAALPPYAFSTPCTEAVLDALEDDNSAEQSRRVELLCNQRDQLRRALDRLDLVEETWPSEANFVLCRSNQPEVFAKRARSAGILVRSFSESAGLDGCIRVSVGTPEENAQLLAGLEVNEHE